MTDTASALGVDLAEGLSAWEAASRLGRHGPNALPPPPRPSVLRQLLAQFLNPLVGTLLVAAGIAVGVAVYGEPGPVRGLARFSDAIAILTIVVVNAVIGFYQERKAERALEALMKLSAARCRLRRGGEERTLDARELVPGDLVLLETGDRVPADLRLVHTVELQTVEGELTGESVPVEKSSEASLPEDTAVGDRATMVFSGTTVVHGVGRGIAVATGQDTQVGRVGKMLEGVKKQQSPLEEHLDDFGQKILYACLALSVALFVLGVAQGHARWHELLLTAVSLAVAAIPEGLPAITSITLALGMQRMAQRGAIVRKLAAVETLGCATVVCTDKTGTLTKNEMTARVIFAGDREIDVTGEGYDDQGELRELGARLEDFPEPVLRTVAVGAIANTASIHKQAEGELKVSGDPTEAALVALAGKVRVARQSMLARSEEALTIPFSSARKRMTVVTRELRPNGTYTVHCKGAADVLLPLCAEERTEAGVVPLTDARRVELLARVARYGARALRVLAMAEREGGAELSDRDEAERRLVFLGLVGMIDPPRREARGAIAECHRAGIRVVMITGDHPGTARSIAEDLGLWEEGALTLTGEELRALSDEALADKLPRVRVFARVDPEHKLRIVQALQARGEVAAMTGDGVNDAPAIKQAAIGVAMGQSGTDVAREAADMVLADDNFATIVDAVREGRAIYRNIQKSIFFLLSSNAGLCLAVFVTGFLSPEQAPPLTALQILWINLVTNGLPALALGVDPPEAGQMREAPRPSGAPILGTMDYLAMLGVGTLMAVCALAVYFLPVWGPESLGHEARTSKLTMVFTLLALSPLAHAFNCRSRSASVFKLGLRSNPYLLGAVLVSGAIHGLSLAIPELQPVFHTDHDWTWPEFAVVVALSLLPIPLVELAKLALASPRAVKPG